MSCKQFCISENNNSSGLTVIMPAHIKEKYSIMWDVRVENEK